jgi:hypothetical protein
MAVAVLELLPEARRLARFQPSLDPLLPSPARRSPAHAMSHSSLLLTVP